MTTYPIEADSPGRNRNAFTVEIHRASMDRDESGYWEGTVIASSAGCALHIVKLPAGWTSITVKPGPTVLDYPPEKPSG